MEENKPHRFITGDDLSNLIISQTNDGKFLRRDFVEPLIQFCADGDYTARLGIVYGLRSTGKTVGMLQAAEELTQQGHKTAYARFNYKETGMRDVNAEITALFKAGYTHFFVDEATYLGGFLNAAAEWADTFVPLHRIKIIISGTDSFLLWLAKGTSLFHRYAEFSTNWVSYEEFVRVQAKTYADYKTGGGIFTNESMPDFIRSALVENLIQSLEHYFDDANRTNEYTSRLMGIDAAVVYKAVVSILKCAVETDVIRHFVQNAGNKNIMDLGSAVSEWSANEKRDIKDRVAEALDIYSGFSGIENPQGVIEALVSFLVKTGCLAESSTGVSDNGKARISYSFNHNALMNYAIEETVQGILSLKDVNHPDFAAGIRQAAEGAVTEAIVLAHILRSANKEKKVFKYRDLENREIDVVIINRKAKTLYLIEIKSKSKIDNQRVFIHEAKHLFDAGVLDNIGVDDSFTVTRVLAFGGSNGYVIHRDGVLLLANIEDLLTHYKDLESFLGRLAVHSQEKYAEKYPKTIADELREGMADIKRNYTPVQKAAHKHEPDIGE